MIWAVFVWSLICWGISLTWMYAIWRRVKRIEERSALQVRDRKEQADLYLHELIEELETRWDTLRTQLDKREDALRALLAAVDRHADRQWTAQTIQTDSIRTAPQQPAEEGLQHSAKGPTQFGQRSERVADILGLKAQGLQAPDIAQRLGAGIGEVELALKLARFTAPGREEPRPVEGA